MDFGVAQKDYQLRICVEQFHYEHNPSQQFCCMVHSLIQLLSFIEQFNAAASISLHQLKLFLWLAQILTNHLDSFQTQLCIFIYLLLTQVLYYFPCILQLRFSQDSFSFFIEHRFFCHQFNVQWRLNPVWFRLGQLNLWKLLSIWCLQQLQLQSRIFRVEQGFRLLHTHRFGNRWISLYHQVIKLFFGNYFDWICLDVHVQVIWVESAF